MRKAWGRVHGRVMQYSLTSLLSGFVMLAATFVLVTQVGQKGPRFELKAFSSAVVTVDAGTVLGPHDRRYERYMSQIHTTKGTKDRRLLRDLGVQLSRGFLRMQHISKSEGIYDWSRNDNFSMNAAMLTDVRGFGAKPIVTIDGVPQWLADMSVSGGVYNHCSPPKDHAKFEKVVRDILGRYKKDWPEIEYIEFWNEPDLNACDVTLNRYLEMYRRAANAVKSVNASLGSGVSKLKIGGPTAKQFSPTWIQGLINYAKANSLPLDFVSWHEYQNKSNPAYFESEVNQVRSWLSDASFPDTTLTFVTEWQDNPGSQTVTASETARKAAFAAVGNYYWMLGGLDVGTVFALSDYANPNRTLLAPAGSWTGKTGQTGYVETDGVPGAVYNVYKMMSMLKGNRVAASSDRLASTGIGVGSLATADASGVAVLVWNYQGGGSVGYTTTVKINNLPDNFSAGNFSQDVYLVDSTRSNYLYDQASAGLAKVYARSLGPSRSSSVSVDLEKNSVALVVLTPGSVGEITMPTNTPPVDPASQPELTPVPTSQPTATATPKLTGVPAVGGNLIINSGFESGKSPWGFYTNGSGSFGTASGGADGSASRAKVTFATLGSNSQMWQRPINFDFNTTYRVSFKAYGSRSGMKMGAFVDNAYSSQKGKVVTLSTAWQAFSFDIAVPGSFAGTNPPQLRFWFANSQGVSGNLSGDVFYIDDVVISPI